MMEIRIKTGNSFKDISVINTYAPHCGYSNNDILNTGAQSELTPPSFLLHM